MSDNRKQINIRVNDNEKKLFSLYAVDYKSVSDYIKSNTIYKAENTVSDVDMSILAINNLIKKYEDIKNINKSDILFNTKINQKIIALKEVLRDLKDSSL